MHHRSWFAALLGACTLFALAPEARADGFYVTFTNGAASLTPRLVGAVFDATGQNPVDSTSGQATGRLMITPVHIEVDNLQVLVPLLTAATNLQSFGATVEFTTPDAQGHEQVYMINKYTGAQVTGWSTTFDPSATQTMKNAVDFTYATVDSNPPPAPAPAPGPAASTAPVKKVTVLRAVTAKPPTLLRLSVPTLVAATPPPHVDDAYFQAPNIPGESSTHPNQTRLTSFSFTILIPRDPQSGLPTGRVTFKPIKISKASGAASSALQSALTNHTNLSTMSVFFNQHRTGAVDLTLASLTLTNTGVSSDSVSVANGTSSENVGLSYQRGSASSGGASVNWEWERAVE